LLSTLAYSRSLTAKLQGTIIGSNAALPAKQVCGLYVTTANPACTARHHQDSSALSSASVSEAPSPGEQLISTGVDALGLVKALRVGGEGADEPDFHMCSDGGVLGRAGRVDAGALPITRLERSRDEIYGY